MNIKEVSEKYEIPADTLRYWERIGAIPPVQRSASGYRDYDEEDQQWVYWTNCTRKAGVSLERIVEYIDLFKAGDQTIPKSRNIWRRFKRCIMLWMRKLPTMKSTWWNTKES